MIAVDVCRRIRLMPLVDQEQKIVHVDATIVIVVCGRPVDWTQQAGHADATGIDVSTRGDHIVIVNRVRASQLKTNTHW